MKKNLIAIAAVLTLLSCGGGGSSPATVVPPPAATVAPTNTPTQIQTATVTPTPTDTPIATTTPTATKTPTATPAAPFAPVEISRVGQWGSVYDNWVIKSGGKYVQFRCQNTASPVERDRVWRSESPDGVSNWTNDRIVIEGTSETAQDDLSCSPGVVIDPNGLWHMYYVTAARGSMCTIEMWHATSPDGLSSVERLPALGWRWGKGPMIGYMQKSDCLPMKGPMSAQDFLKYLSITMRVAYIGDAPMPDGLAKAVKQWRDSFAQIGRAHV